MILVVPTEVVAPDGATHYTSVGDVYVFYKKMDIGAVGEHWFYFAPVQNQGVMVSHRKPHWVSQIPEEWKK